VRIEVLGDFLGDDGLKIKDIPELSINDGEPEFSSTPAMIVVRKNLSKIGRLRVKCGSLEYDHIIPVSKGGEQYCQKHPDSLCETCNRSKGIH